jgi:hypothetical protein
VEVGGARIAELDLLEDDPECSCGARPHPPFPTALAPDRNPDAFARLERGSAQRQRVGVDQPETGRPRGRAACDSYGGRGERDCGEQGELLHAMSMPDVYGR